MPLPVEQVGAPVVVLISYVQREARFPLIVVETEDRNICLQCKFECRDLNRFDWLVDSVQVFCHEVVVLVPWPVATAFDFYSCREEAVTKTPVFCVFHVQDALLEGEELSKFA